MIRWIIPALKCAPNAEQLSASNALEFITSSLILTDAHSSRDRTSPKLLLTHMNCVSLKWAPNAEQLSTLTALEFIAPSLFWQMHIHQGAELVSNCSWHMWIVSITHGDGLAPDDSSVMLVHQSVIQVHLHLSMLEIWHGTLCLHHHHRPACSEQWMSCLDMLSWTQNSWWNSQIPTANRANSGCTYLNSNEIRCLISSPN